MNILEINSLGLALPGLARPLLADVGLTVARGEIVGLVGESGSGKSTTARAVLGLFPRQARTSGSITVGGTEVLGAGPAALREVRVEKAAMVYQSPAAALNPVRTVGSFATEQLVVAKGVSPEKARAEVLQLFSYVGLRDPERAMRQRPHQLSGGMLQRVVIAAALAARPQLLLADEATSALDVSTQAEIVALLLRLREERGLGMLFITHDLTLASTICDRVVVMYAGRVVEDGPADRIFTRLRHPTPLRCTPARPSWAVACRCDPSRGSRRRCASAWSVARSRSGARTPWPTAVSRRFR